MITEQSETAEVVQFSGLSSRIEVSSEQSGGAFNVMLVSVEPGRGGPPHISVDEDKYFHVLDGTFEFVANERRYRLTRNDSLSVRRGDVHGFTNSGTECGCLLLVSTPAGHAEFFREMASLGVPHDPQQVAEICRKHKQILIEE